MKIFVLLSRFPYPLEKGDKLRAFHQIKELSKNNEIILCALSDEKVTKESIAILAQFCTKIEVIRLQKIKIYFNLIFSLFFSNQSLQVTYFYSKKAQKIIDKIITENKPDHIYCQLIRVAEYIRKKKIHKTLDYMDALARGMERRVEDAPFYMRWFLKIEATRLKRYEHFVFDDFDYTTIISEQDKNLIVNIKNETTIVVPNGVDYTTYQTKDLSKKYDLIFTGNMAYPPNVDSAVYLANEIMPLVWKQKPEIKLVIVGAKPTPKVLKLKSSKIIVTGWVDDMSVYYAKSKVFVAPMQIGTGLQNKLLEAMAMQIPCITSTLANNALNAEPNKSVLIGENPNDYANHIVQLLENKDLYQKIANNGFQFVKQNYTWQGSTSILEKLITKNE